MPLAAAVPLITRALSLFFAAPGDVVELRALDVVTSSYRTPHVVSGYFDDVDKLAAAAASVGDSARGVYITANPVQRALLARAANRVRPMSSRDPLTSDKDIAARRWLLVDFDAVPVAGVSASDAEHDAALEAALVVKAQLLSEGWPFPVTADSGNGAHLLYRVDLFSNDGGLSERTLKALAYRFGGEYSGCFVRVDTTNHNPARIWKLYGTVARKGDDTSERPHRLSHIVDVPEQLQVVAPELMEALASEWAPTPPASLPVVTFSDFNLDRWLADYAPDAIGPTDWQGGRRWVFPVCPWDDAHTNKSAFIIQHSTGAIAAGCHHNGCTGRDWHALRDVREPGWRARKAAERTSPSLAEVFTPPQPSHNGHKPSTPITVAAPITAGDGVPTPEPVGLDRVNECYARGETGDAELLSILYANRLAYDHTEKRWHMFGGQHWARDRRNTIVTLMSSVVASKYVSAASEHTQKGNPEFAEKLVARAGALRAKKRITDVLTLAQSLRTLALTGEEWDRQPDLLAVANGTLDLRAGIFSDGSPQDYLRVSAPTAWAGMDAPAPRWTKFISEIFAGDSAVVEFIQRLFGYALTGHTTEHILPVFWGHEGRNGKDTLIETLSSVLGPLANVVSKDVVLESFRGSAGGGPTPHLYSLYGLRMAWVSETNKTARLDIGQVKMLTGGGRITARPLHGMPITFTPTHLLCLITNHRPHIPPDEMAMWSRVLLVPFTQRFVDDPSAPNEHQRDPQLKDKLRAEAPGILAWLVRGCLEWRRVGLCPPKSVIAAVEDYRKAEDYVGQFIDDCCERVSFGETSTADLYDAFLEWGGKRMDKAEFGKQLGRHGFVSNNNKRARGWVGVRLIVRPDKDIVPREFAP